MNFIEDSYEENTLKQRLLSKKYRPYLLFTTTSIITGLLILITIIAITIKMISLSTIIVDILMILWHIILLMRINSIEKNLSITKADLSQYKIQNDNFDDDIDWI